MKTTFRSKLVLAGLICGLAGGVAHATATATAAATTTTTTTTAAAPAVPNAADPAHIALAQTYVEASGIVEDVKAAVEEIAAKVPPDQRVLFRSIADKSIDYAKLKNAATIQVSNQFTDDEIKAMTKFFSSSEGKSVRRKLPAFQASLQPAMVETLQGFVMKLKENNITVDVNGSNPR